LHFTPEQTKQLEEFQKGITGTIEKMLTDEQRKELKEMFSGGGRRRGGAGGSPQFGQIMPGFLQERLKLTADQKKQVGELQREGAAALDRVLTGEQKEQLKGFEQMLKDLPAGGFAGSGPGAAGGAGGFGTPGGNPLFRAYRYAPTYPGLAGKELMPREAVGDLKPKERETK
jgi:hypothetical protein